MHQNSKAPSSPTAVATTLSMFVPTEESPFTYVPTEKRFGKAYNMS